MSTTPAESISSIACIACGQQKHVTHFDAVFDYISTETFAIDRCENCGLMVTRPMPDDQNIGRYYPPRYRGNRHGFTGTTRTNLRRFAVEKCFKPGFKGRLLDIGCGNGTFALAMKNAGWTVCATEIDEPTVQSLNERGITTKTPWDAMRDGFGQPFDAITCWHVMEHVLEPTKVSQWAASMLNPNGVFQATVPNADCLQARFFGNQWLHLDVPRHRFHFTPSTFEKVLTDSGLSVIKRSVFAWEYDWFGIIQSALNPLCSKPNMLFDQLTGAPDKHTMSAKDKALSFGVGSLIAGASFVPMVIAAIFGDGATLTYTCQAK